jgi:phosphatidate phosphatase APP1
VSSNRPFVAARVELWVDQRVERALRALGWKERVIAYTGYGSEDGARLLGRIVLSPNWEDTELGKATEEFLRQRGWRNFVAAACVHATYSLTFGDAVVQGTSDRGGYIDQRLREHGVEPGWATATVSTSDGRPFDLPVLVVPRDETFGIVSDIDDTVISTMLPRPLIAAWNTFFRTESARQAVPGMAVMYMELLDQHPDAPIVYLSTGAWNTQGFLRRFLERHRFPDGPMLLTDWGPTNTGWFRSGMAHKRSALLQLSIDFPKVRWLLVGDDGQHDPEIYHDFARSNPERVRAIAIRQLNPTEQWLAHGTLEPISPAPDGAPQTDEHEPPIVRAADGRGLLRLLRTLTNLQRA